MTLATAAAGRVLVNDLSERARQMERNGQWLKALAVGAGYQHSRVASGHTGGPGPYRATILG